MKIILCGYMGSGKSSIGLRLAESAHFNFQDLDNFISKLDSRSIRDIFSESGEVYFRKLERQALEQLLLLEEDTVIALGGGTPCYGTNLDFILAQPDVQLIYLKADIGTLAERLQSNSTSRPLLSDLMTENVRTEFIAKHLFERSFYYEQAHHIVRVDSKTKEEVIRECTRLF